MAYYVAFRSSERLHRTTDGFIQRMREPAPRLEPATIESIMADFLDQSLAVFFLRPAELVGLSGGMLRGVTLAADTINKAARLVVSRAAKKLDLAQHRETARYMDQMRRMIPADDGSEDWYVLFPIEDTLAGRLEQAMALCEAGQPDQARPALVEYLHALTDVALYWYFEQPIKLLGFGPIMRKMADVALDTTRKATHGVIRKVFADLKGEQVEHATRYMHSLLRTL